MTDRTRQRTLGPIADLQLGELFQPDSHSAEPGGYQLVCPLCGSEYIRSTGQPAFDGTGTDHGGTAYRKAHGADWVRNWTDILPFQCESGCRFALHFGQHKGLTFFRVIAAPHGLWDAVLCRDYGRAGENCLSSASPESGAQAHKSTP